MPLRPEQHCDGTSLLPLLQGGSLPERPLFWHYPHYSNQGGAPEGVVRLGRYKLIEWYEDLRVELYDLQNDLGEHQNLAARMPEKAEELRGRLHAWRNQVNAQMPTPNPEYNPAGVTPARQGKKGPARQTSGYSTDALKMLAQAGLQND